MDEATKQSLISLLTRGAVGAGVGGLALGGLTTAFGPSTDPETKQHNILRNTLLGAALGGVGGAGFDAFKQIADDHSGQSPFSWGNAVRKFTTSNLANTFIPPIVNQAASLKNQLGVKKFLNNNVGKNTFSPLDTAGKPIANTAQATSNLQDLIRNSGYINSPKNPAVLEQMRAQLHVPSSVMDNLSQADKTRVHENIYNILGTNAEKVPFTEGLMSMFTKRQGPGNSQYGYFQPRNVGALTGMESLPWYVKSPNMVKNPLLAGAGALTSWLINRHSDPKLDAISSKLNPPTSR